MSFAVRRRLIPEISLHFARIKESSFNLPRIAHST
jgi:hypothetical protein